MIMNWIKRCFVLLVIPLVLYGCAPPTAVRDAVKIDYSLPVGKIEGNQFTGIRFPFKVSAPPSWQMSTEFPAFLKDLGYDEPDPRDKEQTELYLFNPRTQSNVQIDFTDADRYTVFSQALINGLVSSAGTGSFIDELEQEYGKDINPQLSPTERISLKGVQYAAKKYATYTVKGVKREQGWIYAFTEPYQIFILYMLLDTGGEEDREALKKILASFEVVPKK
jgi:hypothetical protein